MRANTNKLKVAFVVGEFPKLSETFIINQIADLLDRDLHVEVFAYVLGESNSYISSRFHTYGMSKLTQSLQPSVIFRFASLPQTIGNFFRLVKNPASTLRMLKYCWKVRSFRAIFKITPFIGKHFDLIHCHFGEIANRFLLIQEALQIKTPLITTFYGYDVSKVFKECSRNVYDDLMRKCSLFFVMSADMKRRVVARGFPDEQVKVLPVSIDVESYPFSERILHPETPIEFVSVGRFVEKKGLDDVIRAIAIVKQRTTKPFRCSIIGSGPLEQNLRELASSLTVTDKIDFKGYMKVEDIIQLFPAMHIMVQPSKTASDGDME